MKPELPSASRPDLTAGTYRACCPCPSHHTQAPQQLYRTATCAPLTSDRELSGRCSQMRQAESPTCTGVSASVTST